MKQGEPLINRVAFTPPDRVTVRTGKVELGQGIMTALTHIAATTLGVHPDRIYIPPVSTDDAPDEGHTSGSLSIQTSGIAIASACLQARVRLTRVAATALGVLADELDVADGRFLRAGEETGFGYWSFPDTSAEQLIEPPALGPAEASLISGDLLRIDLRAKITGGAFIQDLEFGGMLHARIVRPPEHGARLRDANIEAFRSQHSGVQAIVDGDFLAVACDLEEEAVRAAEYLRTAATWKSPPAEGRPDEIVDWLPGMASSPPRAAGSKNNQLRWYGATYSRPAVAHGSIGPSCAIAWFRDDRLYIWSHSQNVFALRNAVAKVLDLDPASVTVTHMANAGCYGHNGADDAALDAALVARQAGGRPVRIQWSREEELSWAPVGPPMVVRIDAALTESGGIAAWTLEYWTAPHARRPDIGGHPNLLSATMLAKPVPLGPALEISQLFGGGGDRNVVAIYDLLHQRVIPHFLADFPVRTSSLRALGAHANIFAIESMMDELAALADADPLEFRIRHLADPRARRVLRAAAAMSPWGSALVPGEGRGLAVARYKNSSGYAAIVAEVLVEEHVRVTRVWCAADVGKVVSLDGLINQIEGGIIQSISWALCEAAPLGARGVDAHSWKEYPILRFSQTPQIMVSLVGDDTDPPLGGGEIVQGPATAAVGNAVSMALGIRLRTLPMTRERIIAAAS